MPERPALGEEVAGLIPGGVMARWGGREDGPALRESQPSLGAGWGELRGSAPGEEEGFDLRRRVSIPVRVHRVGTPRADGIQGS